ncbi:MAG: asparagine synthase-related protein [Planctomycetota bacterium]
MSDFLISLDCRYTGKDLLNLIKKLYRRSCPEGRYFDFPWGNIAVLEERLACNKNITTKNTTTFAWVGDLTMDMSDSFLRSFIKCVTLLHEGRESSNTPVQSSGLFDKLNGTFAIVVANSVGLTIVTDPLSFIPVYMGKNKRGDIVSFGTHPDLVAVVSDQATCIDVISVGEFLNMGHTIFPHTMHRNVEELKPGSVHLVTFEEDRKVQVRDFCYWFPPREAPAGFSVTELAQELAQSVISAVQDRCCSGKVAVSLSGGLDSRLIMAAVPKEVECIGLTFGNTLNREMKTAQKVAKAYNREWFPLFRDEHFLERSLANMTRLSGCESEWIHAHAGEFEEKIREIGVDTLFDGNGIDEFLKGYHVKDIVPVKRLRGILPNSYQKINFDYVNNISTFCKSNIREDAIEFMRERRSVFYNNNLDRNRTSMAELLATYPHSQDYFCIEERRLLPIRTCGADRRILDFGFKCPATLKLDNQILFMACREIYAKGCRIPSANDGVRPCSGHLSRLAQRGIRKLQDGTINLLEKFGKESKVQYSWHDYQEYWDNSVLFRRMSQDYGAYLNEFDDKLFKGRGQDFLKRKGIDWRNGYRLLQLAVWRGTIDNYGL